MIKLSELQEGDVISMVHNNRFHCAVVHKVVHKVVHTSLTKNYAVISSLYVRQERDKECTVVDVPYACCYLEPDPMSLDYINTYWWKD